jgi:predicted nucleic acid-binding protein
MGLLSALTNPAAPLVADASTIINLIATGTAPAILNALPHRLAVVDVVPTELETGRARGWTTIEGLRILLADKMLDVVALPEQADAHFEGLVVGAAAETLDDGEAATIAYALSFNAVALIDERKATRICAERFPHLALASTVDVFCHPEVQRQLGADALGIAVYNALREGRMSVLPGQVEWVVGIIGPERAALCGSLPRRVRT